MTQDNAKKFQKQGYIQVKSAISKEVCENLSAYARTKAKAKPNIKKGRDPLAHIHREYGDDKFEALLEELKPRIEKETGLSLWPTLSFYYVYGRGNQLNPHKDRESCEIVAGICLGSDPAFQEQTGNWPLILDVQGKAAPMDLGFGDMVIFRGNEMEHWRDSFDGDWFVSIILGYVDKNGPHAYQKYDQRTALGKPHVGMFTWMWGRLRGRLRNKLSSFA